MITGKYGQSLLNNLDQISWTRGRTVVENTLQLAATHRSLVLFFPLLSVFFPFLLPFFSFVLLRSVWPQEKHSVISQCK